MSASIRGGTPPGGERVDRLTEEIERLDAALRVTIALLVASVIGTPILVATAISPMFRTPLFASLSNLAGLWTVAVLLVSTAVWYTLSVLK